MPPFRLHVYQRLSSKDEDSLKKEKKPGALIEILRYLCDIKGNFNIPRCVGFSPKTHQKLTLIRGVTLISLTAQVGF